MTKFRLSLLVICLMSAGSFAAPHWGDVFELEQPDLSLVKVKVWGDEFYQRVESFDGYTLIRDPATGWICYAELSEDGLEFVPTDEIYLGDVDRGKNGNKGKAKGKLKKHLKLKRRSILKKAEKRRRELLGESLVGEQPLSAPGEFAGDIYAAPVEGAPAPLNGSLVGLTLLIQFPDQAGTITPQEVDDYCNQIGYSLNDNNGSIRDFFGDVSNGQLDYTNVVTEYYTSKYEKSYYDNCDGGRPGELIGEALNWLDDQGFDFRQLSLDGNRIMALNVFHASSTSCGWAKGLWPHKGWYSGFTSDSGVTTGDYQITGMGSSLRIGTFCHENGHMICKWPDLYDYGYESSGTGGYCLMSSGHGGNPQSPNPYFKDLKGWQNVIDVTDDAPGTVRTSQANSFTCYRYSHPTNSREFFMIENREKSGRSTNISDEGLLIWHVDEDGSNNNEQMTWDKHYRVSVEQADGQFHLENGQGGGSNDLFHFGNNDTFNDDTLPDAKWWDSVESGLAIRDISGLSSNMSFVVDNRQINMVVSPGYEQVFNGLKGGPFDPMSTDLSVANYSGGSISWSVSSGASWLSVSGGGTLTSGGTTTVTASLSGVANTLNAGTYEEALVFTDMTNGVSYRRNIRLVVEPRQIVAYWKFDETSGSTGVDSSGNGFDGTLSGFTFDTYAVDGKYGSALKFPSGGNMVEIGAEDIPVPWTACMWIKRKTNYDSSAALLDSDVGSLRLEQYRDTDKVGVSKYGTTDSSFNYSAPIGIWVHLAFVGTSSGTSLYVNGAYQDNLSVSIPCPMDTFGTEPDELVAVVDEVLIYNYDLDSDAIAAVAAGTRTEIVRPAEDATSVLLNAKLAWMPAPLAASSDLYFGASYDAVADATTESLEYKGRPAGNEYPLMLLRYTDYFWRIDMIDEAGAVTTGQVWSFKTGDGTGAITREVWTDITGVYVTDLTNNAAYPDSPDVTEELTSFEGPSGWGDNYGSRIHGFLLPKVSGSYTFWIAGDDYCKLWLSDDEDPAGAVVLGKVPGYSDVRQWDKFTNQQSAPVELVAGRYYYILAAHKEGGGGDHVAVAWEGPGISQQVIDGSYLMPYSDGYQWWPVFVNDLFAKVDAIEGYDYLETLAGEVTIGGDGGVLTFSKLAGSDWLSVGGDGSLAGVPGNDRVGMNYFMISATDENGSWADAELQVSVLDAFTGELGLLDFAGFAGRWLDSGCVDVPACGGADLTGDGAVGVDDLQRFAWMWLADYGSDGLIGHWTFDVDGSDSVGTFDGSLVGDATVAAGTIGGAVSLDGDGDYVEMAGLAGVTGGAARTVSAWIKSTGVDGEIVTWGEVGPAGRSWIMRTSATGLLRVEVGSGKIVGTTVVNDGQWHHLAAVLIDDGTPNVSQVQLYVDGVRETLSVQNNVPIDTGSVSPVRVGVCVEQGGGRYFDGLVDDVRIYERAMMAGEVLKIYNQN